ncbi:MULTISPECIES: hypothetical protein [unclassified Clostridioides]|uniref:hypothetical protein n=1 Tax=unclassified Clostridioides TaxID=2635829 RepID=UPI001D12762D|nr:hypothetical protein [Clostridioides sp. ES-S-0145-01]MCC0681909.1 hypothetical protein [Clostridioides sp. ES-S-0005-03]MCC0709341.1 hypothetical protein [Clostridioides sp. ES-S-0190-01]UDN64104.1 hypothetical protein IC758_19710 [Clostridioides sp. ES-W-0016-02]
MKKIKGCIIVGVFIAILAIIVNNLDILKDTDYISTKCAFDLVEEKVPKEAIYQGYKKNQVKGETVLYYAYKDASHIVTLSHPENVTTREIDWNEVCKMKFD